MRVPRLLVCVGRPGKSERSALGTRHDQGVYRCANRLREIAPGRNFSVQIGVKRRQVEIIGASRMRKRPVKPVAY
jgi:hypothetical protein